jgi:hypothetical protein
MKFKKTVTILLVAFVVASLAVTAVSISHSDGKSIDDKSSVSNSGQSC